MPGKNDPETELKWQAEIPCRLIKKTIFAIILF
jgi:hypothetical protein